MNLNNVNLFRNTSGWNENPVGAASRGIQGLGATLNLKKQAQDQVFQNKVSALSNTEQTGQTKQKKKEVIIVQEAKYPLFEISEEQIPGKIADSMEQYYSHAGNLADNITYFEENLKFLQSEYEKYQGDTVKTDRIAEEIQRNIEDMSWLVEMHMGMQNGFIKLSNRFYGEKYSKAAKSQLGDMAAYSNEIAAGLKGAVTLEEAMEQLAAAKEKVMGMAEEVKNRYSQYTGKELSAYEYKKNEDYAGTIQNNLIYDYEIGELKGESSLKISLKDLEQLKGPIPEAVNLLNRKA